MERAPLRSYYLLHGDDAFLVERGLARLRARLAAEAGEAGIRIVWGDDEPARLGAAIEDVASPSLFGGASVLIVRRAEALPSAMEEALATLAVRLDARGRLVLVAKSLDQRRRLHAAWAKAGAAVAFTRPEPRAIPGWVTALARERGHAIAPPGVDALIARAGHELARLDDEIEKLSLAVGPGAAIERRHVEGLVATTRAQAIDELTDRLARRDVAGAMRALRGLLAGGEAPLRIVAFLAANLRRALHVSELAAAGVPESEIAGRLGLPSWLVSRQQRGAPEALEAALAGLAELDLALKSSRPEAATFEATVLDIAAGGAAGRGSRVSS